ncbi:vhs [Trichoderma arundinaceum]|uniref:Vhs n=1 Tax=Trichoderma arundinaceum TaxID=490622 RepID=A0A395N828_TRIAR|nr:vhs [Trichoderma arundinaceum]
MKSMKGLSMNKMLGSIRKKTVGTDRSSAATPGDTPEVTAHNSVSDEVLFLPPIVDAAESSPTAAAECARIIRKYLAKEYSSRPSWQYNAIMLMRILADNPGETFTRNLDTKFVDTARALLKGAKDNSVRQILMDTLDDFERTKFYDENLTLIITMWKEEKDKAIKQFGSRAPTLPQRPAQSDSFNGYSQNYFSRHHNNLRLPEPVELTSRLEEARSSAKLLEQLVMNTPAVETLDNDLIKEFANRCLSASRSIQGYMVSTDPAPDNDTMENLIDTNEQLQSALSQHQRAMLSARKQLGLNERSENPSPAPEQQSLHGSNGSNGARGWQVPAAAGSSSNSSPAPLPNVSAGNGKGKDTDIYSPPSPPPPAAVQQDPGRGRAPPPDPFPEDPFSDPQPGGSSSNGQLTVPIDEPFHPGFGLNHQRDGSSTHGTTGSGVASENHSTHNLHADYEVSDDEDLYTSAPRSSKEPMYRY